MLTVHLDQRAGGNIERRVPSFDAIRSDLDVEDAGEFSRWSFLYVNLCSTDGHSGD